ncbi:MAG: DegQ family serine endoprotease [Gammaproteobacteria bacterium]|jgi:serine protease Do
MKAKQVWMGALALFLVLGVVLWFTQGGVHHTAGGTPFTSNSLIPNAVAGTGDTAADNVLSSEKLPNFVQLVKDNQAAVVNISTTETITRKDSSQLPDNIPENSPFGEFFKRFFNDQGGPGGSQTEKVHSLGSGFIISSDGYILTNAHVVNHADHIVVGLHDRRELTAKLVGMDKLSDIALLKIKATGLHTVKIGNSDKLQVGQWVLAIGSPFGFNHSATQGIVSALHRNLPKDTYVPFIQTDVAVNPGNSGGPLFNTAGEVVGINSEIYTNTGGYEGLSFAIPINVAMNVAKQLKAHGHVTRGWLGVLIQPVTQKLAEAFGMKQPGGALVAQVEPDSPAHKAGLQAGDIIDSFDHHPISDSAQLPPLVANTPIGKTVPLGIIRNGESKTLHVTIEKLKHTKTETQPSEQPHHRLNMVVTDLSSEQRQQLGVQNGILIKEVGEGPAADAGLRPGDVILMLAGHEVTGTAQFSKLVSALPKGKPVPILVQRHHMSLFLSLTVPAGH